MISTSSWKYFLLVQINIFKQFEILIKHVRFPFDISPPNLIHLLLVFKKTLEHDIIGEENNPSKRIFLALLQSNRPEDNAINDKEILKDARDLYETESKWKTDESIFLRLLCTRRLR